MKSLLIFLFHYSLTFSESQKLIKSAHYNTSHMNPFLCIIIANTLVKFLIISCQYFSKPPLNAFSGTLPLSLLHLPLGTSVLSFVVFKALNYVHMCQSITNSDVFSSISLAISSADFTKLYQPVLILLSKLFFVLFPPRNTFILSPFFLHWIDHYFSRCGQLVHEEFSKYIITPIRLYIIHFRVNLPMFCGGMSYLPKRFNPLQDHIFMFMPQASSRCSSNAELNLKKKNFSKSWIFNGPNKNRTSKKQN